jgi:outer membrane protein OmpA-like peptidoglycan-associated protein
MLNLRDTRDTARGLVVNMSDVLFDSGKYTLRPLAREKLAKISGIVLGYPSLKLAVEPLADKSPVRTTNHKPNPWQSPSRALRLSRIRLP